MLKTSTPQPNNILRVLAVDPGYDRLGVAVMERGGQHGVILFSDCIETNRKDVFETRLTELGTRLEQLLLTYTPNIVALERLYLTNNQKTAMRVAEVRGVVVYLAGRYGCTLLEYTPQEIKVAVTGYGNSDKGHVTSMVQRFLPSAKKDALDDEYDALAIAMTALASYRPQLSTEK